MKNILIIVFLLLLGITTLYAGIKMRVSKYNLDAWQKTKGTILEKRVDKKQLASGSSRANFRVYVTYEYVVNDKTYQSNIYNAIELSKGEIASLENMAVKEMNELPTEVTVYYNPENAMEAYLYNQSSAFSWVAIVVGVLMMLIGVGMIFGLD